MSRPLIRVAAVVVRDHDGRVLTVRKRGTQYFMQPGGKAESGESFVDAAARELGEELGLTLAADRLEPLGVFSTDAANEAGHALEGHCFLLPGPVGHDDVAAAAEIEELRWFTVAELLEPAPGTLVAPLLSRHVAPLLRPPLH